MKLDPTTEQEEFQKILIDFLIKEISEQELFYWLTESLLKRPENVAIVIALLDYNPEAKQRFIAWLKSLKPDTELLLLQRVVQPSAELLKAIEIWDERNQ